MTPFFSRRAALKKERQGKTNKQNVLNDTEVVVVTSHGAT